MRRKTSKQNLFTKWKIILGNSIDGFIEDRVLRMGASLAYYTVFSLPALLFLIIGTSGIFFSKEAIEGKIFFELRNILGEDTAKGVQDTVKHVVLQNDNVFTAVIGFFTLLISATSIFGEIQDSINIIWRVQAKPKKGIRAFIFNRLLSFSMLLVLGFIFLVALIANAALELLLNSLHRVFPEKMLDSLYIFDYGLTFCILVLLFAFIYKFLPDVKLLWKEVIVGGATSTLLFMVGKIILSYYLKNNSIISTYGGAGHMIALLLWVYYSAIILYIGAELTYAYVHYSGRKVKASNFAVIYERDKNPPGTPCKNTAD